VVRCIWHISSPPCSAAGVFPGAPLVDQDVESYQSSFDVNVRAPYFLTAALAPGMVARGKGSIVNVSTIAGLGRHARALDVRRDQGRAGVAHPDLGRRARRRGHPGQRRGPGPTATEMFTAMGPENTDPIAASTILERPASPEEIARVIVFVGTEAGSYLTGATIAADAGRTAA
jgi:NAD(P)-dependent dehydrogenase (short-subunit alcohol dehydrogenase family)